MKNKAKDRIGILLMLFGYICIASAAALFLYNVWDDNRAGKRSEAILQIIDYSIDKSAKNTEVASDSKYPELNTPVYVRYPQMEMPTVTVDGVKYIGRLDIPELELSLPVAEEYDRYAMKDTPCCIGGSAYLDDIMIEAYSYECHFKNIDELEDGSPVYFTDIDGNCFAYETVHTDKIKSEELSSLTSDDWDMTLIAYRAGGFSSFAVRCERVE